MGMYDALTLVADHVKGDWTKMFTGAYSVSFGDNLSSFIGSGRQTHIVGDEIKYVLDWEGVLGAIPGLGALLHSMPMSVLFGDGGNMTWTFGRKTDLHYIGPAIGIKRAGEKKATSQGHFFTSPPPSAPTVPTLEDVQKAAVDKSTGIMVALLSSAMLAVNTGVEIAARIKYQDNYKNKDKAATEEMTKYCTTTLMLTTRMMYIIKAVELTAAVARNSVSDFCTAKGQLQLGTFALACSGMSPALQKDIGDRLSKAADAVSKFVRENIILIAAIAYILFLLGIVATLLATSVSKK